MGGVFPVSEKPDACMSQGWDWNEQDWYLVSFENNSERPVDALAVKNINY